MEIQPSKISKFSLAFIKRFRVTIILFLAILSLGYLSYTTFLKREGFPPIEVPIVFVQAPYFVGDVDVVDEAITNPLESVIGEINEVKEINSTTTENFAIIIAELELGTDAKEGKQIISDQVAKEVQLPEDVDITYQIFDASAVDGENNLLFSISADGVSIEEMQKKAEMVAEKVSESSLVNEATVQKLISTQVNPITGQEFELQDGFNRVGVKENGELKFSPAVTIGVKGKKDVGSIELSDSVKEKIDIVVDEGDLENYTISYGGDFSKFLKEQVSSLEENAIAGLIAVIIVLFLFVSWRASIVTAIFIPTVMAATFIVLYVLGYSLNVISLFSLILVLGLFVDDAIVVVEAIDVQKRQGKKGKEAVVQAINDIGAADVMGTLTTIIVFAPILFATGVLGDFIQLIPITVIISLTMSLLIALSIIPFFSNIIIKYKKPNKKPSTLKKVWNILIYGFSNMILYIAELVKRFVGWYLNSKILTLVVIVVGIITIGIGMYYSNLIKFSIFPSPKDTNEIQVSIDYGEGQNIKTAEKIAKDVEKIIVDEYGEEILSIDYFDGSQNSASMYVVLTDLNEREVTATKIVEDLNEEFVKIKSAKVKVDKSSAGPPGNEYPFAMQIFSSDDKVALDAAMEVEEYIKSLELTDGNEVTEVVIDNVQVIAKKNGQRFIQVKAKLSDPTDTSLTLEVIEKVEDEYDEEKLKALGLTAEAIEFDLGQESENLESFTSLAFAGIAAIILIYVLLVWQFNSFFQPFLILLAVPLSFFGLFIGLYYTDNAFSFFAMLGIIGLIGIDVNNTIMLVDFANQARGRGMGIRESIVEAIGIRFRPLITTSVTTLAGLLPLALTDPFWEPLAFSIVFGLISSTILVILVFPAFYAVIEKVRVWKYKIPWLVNIFRS